MPIAPMLLATAVQVAPNSSSGLLNAGQLKDRCEASTAAEISYCFAYIAGVYDTVHAYESWLKLREFCPPADVAQGDLRRAFIEYLDNKPGYRAGEAASVVVVALKERYACAASNRPTAPRP